MAIYFPNSELGEVCGETWRITSNFTGDNNLFGANSMTNWERADDVYGGGNMASSPVLSLSNGQFSFNYEGYYLVNWQAYNYHTVDSRYNEMKLYVSWNNGANWDVHGYTSSHITIGTNGNNSAGGHATSVVAGTNAARLRFGMNVENNSVVTYGSTADTVTGFTVVKISEL